MDLQDKDKWWDMQDHAFPDTVQAGGDPWSQMNPVQVRTVDNSTLSSESELVRDIVAELFTDALAETGYELTGSELDVVSWTVDTVLSTRWWHRKQ